MKNSPSSGMCVFFRWRDCSTAYQNDQLSHDIQIPIHGLEDIGQIYNLACPASPIQYQKDPVSTLRTCFHGTENLLGLAKALNIRILHTSTSGG